MTIFVFKEESLGYFAMLNKKASGPMLSVAKHLGKPFNKTKIVILNEVKDLRKEESNG